MDRVPPYNLESEQSVLSAVLLDNRALDDVMDIITADDFYLGSYRTLWKLYLEMSTKDIPIDEVTLENFARIRGELENIGGPAEISNLSGQVSTASNIGYWAKIVKDKSRLRGLIAMAGNVIDQAYNDPENVDDVVGDAEKAIMDIAYKPTGSECKRVDVLTAEAMDRFEAIREDRSRAMGVPTGLPGIDYLTLGLHPGSYNILGGRPSHGKTTLALNISLHAGMTGHRVLYFALEQGKDTLSEVLVCSHAQVSLSRARSGDIGDKSMDKLWRVIPKFSDMPLWFDDNPFLGIAVMRSKIRRMVREHGIELVVIDYLQLMETEYRSKSNREQEIARLSRSCKLTARASNIAMLVLSQLNREADNKTPRMSNLRESGALEQDMDLCLAIHRQNFEKDREDPKAQVIVLKQRNGPVGSRDVYFDTATGTIREAAEG